MKLIYRGTTYDYNTLKASSRSTRRTTPYTLSYRGVSYQVQPNTSTASVETTTRQLIYRGSTYQVTRTVPVAPSSITAQRPELMVQTV